ncbi:MAG: hypothetical protein E6Q83_18185 [Thiothrix sp.]|nr:MAG: hypothetical protein E6Q83_18185 [Thiothrix sp.]
MIIGNPVTEGLVEIQNDTMQPTLPAGSLVVLNYADTSERDGLAMIEQAGQRKIARISFNGDQVTVWGDNTAYPSKQCQRGDLAVIAHVLRQYAIL